jgi:hypothetical protein
MSAFPAAALMRRCRFLDAVFVMERGHPLGRAAIDQLDSGIATGRIGAPVAPRSLMQAPKKANS